MSFFVKKKKKKKTAKRPRLLAFPLVDSTLVESKSTSTCRKISEHKKVFIISFEQEIAVYYSITLYRHALRS